jgi:hypothetical protein
MSIFDTILDFILMWASGLFLRGYGLKFSHFCATAIII